MNPNLEIKKQLEREQKQRVSWYARKQCINYDQCEMSLK